MYHSDHNDRSINFDMFYVNFFNRKKAFDPQVYVV